jgi:tRNA (guanine-N7-)-methyltransferase
MIRQENAVQRKFNPAMVPPGGHHFPKLPGNAPLDVEVGCGVGLHPIRYAGEHPERHLLAIEQTALKYAKFDRRIKNHPHLTNLYPLHANAISVITHDLSSESVANYFFLYPNPYPAHRRWHRMPFMQQVLDTLIPGGRIHLATNEQEYALEAQVYFESVWNLDLISFKEINQRDFPARTHFEKKYLERNQTCYDLCFEKGED